MVDHFARCPCWTDPSSSAYRCHVEGSSSFIYLLTSTFSYCFQATPGYANVSLSKQNL